MTEKKSGNWVKLPNFNDVKSGHIYVSVLTFKTKQRSGLKHYIPERREFRTVHVEDAV